MQKEMPKQVAALVGRRASARSWTQVKKSCTVPMAFVESEPTL